MSEDQTKVTNLSIRIQKTEDEQEPYKYRFTITDIYEEENNSGNKSKKTK